MLSVSTQFDQDDVQVRVGHAAPSVPVVPS